jgi:hypothetical protein
MRGGPYTLDCNITIMIPAGLHVKTLSSYHHWIALIRAVASANRVQNGSRSETVTR